MSPETYSRLVQTAGHSLLHSLWQGALVWLLTAALLRSQPAMSARFRHACVLLALLLLCAWIGFTAQTQWQDAESASLHVTAVGSAAAVFTTAAPAPPSGGPGTMQWLMAAYLLGLGGMLLRFGGGLLRVYRLRTADAVPPPAGLQQSLERLCLQLDLAQKVVLRISGRVSGPLLIGLLRPVILLPRTALEELSPAALEAVLLHELAHLVRADFLVSLLQSLVETLLFFNPFVWLLSAAIRRERECCCDDLVVAQSGEPLVYARALQLLAARQAAATAPPALGATGPKHHLLHRIKRILQMKPATNRWAQLLAAGVLTLLLTVSVAWLTPGFAQQRKTSRTELQSRKSSQSRQIITWIDSNGKLHRLESRWRDGVPVTVSGPFTDSPERRRPPVPPAAPEPPASPGELEAPFPPAPPSAVAPLMDDSLLGALPQLNWTEMEQSIHETLASLPDERQLNEDIQRDLRQARREAEDALRESRRALADATRERTAALREADRTRREALQEAEEARREALKAGQEAEQARREALRAGREALEEARAAQRKALEDARRQLRETEEQLREERTRREH